MRLFIIFCILFFNSSLNLCWGYSFKQKDCRELSLLIEKSLATRYKEDVEKINQAFSHIQRNIPALEDLIELKYQLQQWRKGLGLIKLQEPMRKLKMIPIKPSKWPFKKWAQISEFSEYDFKDEGVMFRGVFLKPGDMLLANLHTPGDSVYTVASDPRGYYSHYALFAILEENGKRFPSAIEIHEHGVRAVPLSIFLSRQFTTYTEVFRFHSVPKGWEPKINEESYKLIHETNAYDFYNLEESDRYLSCAGVGSCVYKRIGVEPISTKSGYSQHVFLNLNVLGLSMKSLLTPTDYMVDSRVKYVGVFDNDYFLENVTSEIITRKVRRLFYTMVIEPNQFPWLFKFNRWGITQIKNGTWLGSLFLWVEGFSRGNFPHGPTDAMALVEIVESETQKAVDKSKPEIALEIPKGLFSIHDLEENPKVQAIADKNITPIQAWFRN